MSSGAIDRFRCVCNVPTIAPLYTTPETKHAHRSDGRKNTEFRQICILHNDQCANISQI